MGVWGRRMIWGLFGMSTLCGVLCLWMLALVLQGSGQMWLDFVRLLACVANGYSAYSAFRSFYLYRRLFAEIDDQQRRL